MSRIEAIVRGKQNGVPKSKVEKVLKPNMVNGVNLLTQSMVNELNTVYIIRWDYQLDGTIIPGQGSSIILSGGSLNNGTLKLKPWCSITSTGDYAECENLYIKLNYRCLVEKLKIIFDDYIGTNDAIVSYTLSDGFAYYNGNDFHNCNIVLRDLDICQPSLSEYTVNTKYGYGVRFDADAVDPSTAHYLQHFGCYNINFENVVVTGEFKSGFDFEVAESWYDTSDQNKEYNHWFTQINFNNCFIHTCANGFTFNGNSTRGKIGVVGILNCGFQACRTFGYGLVANNSSRISIKSTEFWDFPKFRGYDAVPAGEEKAIIRVDSDCYDIIIDRITSTSAVKAVSIKAVDNPTYWYTANSIKIGSEANFDKNLKYLLDFDNDITIAQLYDIPDGLYVIRAKINPSQEDLNRGRIEESKVREHLGINFLNRGQSGGEGETGIIVSISHAYNFLKVDVYKPCDVYPTLNEPIYSYGGVVVKSSASINTPIKDKWTVTDSIKVVTNKGMLDRLPLIEGRKVYISDINTLAICNKEVIDEETVYHWTDTDGRAVGDTVNI